MPGRRSTRSDILGATVAGLIVVFFCLLLLWHDPHLFWNDDYELSILPVFADVARSWNEGHLPLLSSYSWVCSNLAGEFQYGTFSVFVNAAVILIWKFPLVFSQQAAALSLVHLFVLAAGAFLLARERLRRNEQAGPVRQPDPSSTALSVFVAIVAALNGWIVCWGATDWFGALGAFAWLPWVWWALEKSLASVGGEPSWRKIVIAALWPAPFVYLVITGGFPYVVVMLALLVAWLSCRSLGRTRSIAPILPMLGGVVLGIGLAAPAWLALLDYVRGSAREIQPASAHWQWIVPWRALPALILPCWTAGWADFLTQTQPHTGTELACGLVAPVALLGALIERGRAFVRRIGWEISLLAIVLVLAMLPTAGVFRWSFRWLPFFHLVLALCAAEALRDADARPGGRPRFGLIALFLVGVAAIAMPFSHATGVYSFPFTWILLALAGIWFACERWLRNRRVVQWLPAGLTFAAFLATYLCIPSNCGVPKYNLSQRLTEPAPLDRQRLYLSVYPWAEINYRADKKSGPVSQIVRLGSTSMWAALRFVNGYSPIRPAGVPREFQFSIHGEFDANLADYLLRDRSGALSELGIDGLVIAREFQIDPPATDWQLVFSNEEGRVYHRPGPPFPTVRSVTWIDSIPQREFAPAAVSGINDSRNRVEADVDVPPGANSALLKFSRPYFDGYVAQLGSQNLPVQSYRGLLPMVEVPAGSRGRLVLTYRPVWLLEGGAIALSCLAVLLIGLLFSINSRK